MLIVPPCWHPPLVLIRQVCLAGVGPYTGNAIASIAGNERVAVVDANVIRVLARLLKLSGDTKNKEATKHFARLAQDLVDPDRPGCFNQVHHALHNMSTTRPPQASGSRHGNRQRTVLLHAESMQHR